MVILDVPGVWPILTVSVVRLTAGWQSDKTLPVPLGVHATPGKRDASITEICILRQP